MRHVRSLCAALSLGTVVAAVSSCSSDSVGTPLRTDAGTGCGASAACGGSLVGTWSLTSQCLNVDELTLGVQQGFYCPHAVVTAVSAGISWIYVLTSNHSSGDR